MYNEVQIYFSISVGHGGAVWSLTFLNAKSIHLCSEFPRALSNKPAIQILSLSATDKKLVTGKMSELPCQSGGHFGQCGHFFSYPHCDLLYLSSVTSVSKVVIAASNPYCLHLLSSLLS